MAAAPLQLPGSTALPQATAPNGLVPMGTAPSPSGVVNPLTATSANPYATTSGATQGGIPWTEGSNTVGGDFNATYGQGTGTAIGSVLSNLGTSTDQAVTALTQNTNLEANNQYANIQAQEAAGGVTPNSSTAALAQGDFYSQVNSSLQSQVAGMESSEEDTLLNALMTEGSAHGGDTSTLDSITSALGSIVPGLSSAASGVSSAVSAASPSSDTSWLDVLGAL